MMFANGYQNILLCRWTPSESVSLLVRCRINSSLIKSLPLPQKRINGLHVRFISQRISNVYDVFNRYMIRILQKSTISLILWHVNVRNVIEKRHSNDVIGIALETAFKTFLMSFTFEWYLEEKSTMMTCNNLLKRLKRLLCYRSLLFLCRFD